LYCLRRTLLRKGAKQSLIELGTWTNNADVPDIANGKRSRGTIATMEHHSELVLVSERRELPERSHNAVIRLTVNIFYERVLVVATCLVGGCFDTTEEFISILDDDKRIAKSEIPVVERLFDQLLNTLLGCERTIGIEA
jgi:hypothetical protein